MGFGDFFKKIFGKKICTFCGAECGMLSRTKIKGDEYICSKCDDKCSKHIQLYKLTKPEIEGHMEYMKRQDRIYNEVCSGAKSELYPGGYSKQAIEFFDQFGMFRILDRDDSRRERPVEMFRYDQVEKWEPYIDEREPTEPGKEKEFEECGVKLTLVGAEKSLSTEIKPGTMAHPYIKEPIKICFTKSASDKESMLYSIEHVLCHFNYIFGVNDDVKGLFSFGMTKEEKRNLKAGVAFTKTAFEAIKMAKNGETEISDEKKAEIQENMNAISDAQTGGLAVYSRRADEAEAKII